MSAFKAGNAPNIPLVFKGHGDHLPSGDLLARLPPFSLLKTREINMMNYWSGWCQSDRRLDGHTAIVTGCNAGIGKETAKDLYKRGGRIIMACRNVEKAITAKREIEDETKDIGNTGVLVVEQLDLCSLKSVREFANRLLETETGIQILVNNAGVMMCPESRTEDGFETQIGSNHFGHALLTLLLLPALIKSAPSRVVFVSSILHERSDVVLHDINFDRTPYDAYKAYCSSKGANVLFARALALKLKEHNIHNVTTYSLHPGVISTGIGRYFDKTIWYGASWLFNNIMRLFNKSPRCGAQTTIYCAVDEACGNESGLYYSDCAVKTPSKQARDDDAVAKLWSVTLEMLQPNLQEHKLFGDT